MSYAMESLYGRTLEPIFFLVGSLREAHALSSSTVQADAGLETGWSRAARRQAIAEAAKGLRHG